MSASLRLCPQNIWLLNAVGTTGIVSNFVGRSRGSIPQAALNIQPSHMNLCSQCKSGLGYQSVY